MTKGKEEYSSSVRKENSYLPWIEKILSAKEDQISHYIFTHETEGKQRRESIYEINISVISLYLKTHFRNISIIQFINHMKAVETNIIISFPAFETLADNPFIRNEYLH